jgi:spermidine synthase
MKSALTARWLLFVSGAAALGHQVIWTRRLVDLLGAGPDTFAKVIGTFFVGLALGGTLSALKPVKSRHAWRRVALAELSVALLA